MNATAWNRLRYTLWAPFYDQVARFGRQRRRSIELLNLRGGERLLVVGAGTGADLPFVPPGVEVLATDLTPAMLERARPRVRPGMELRVMDGQALDLPDAGFDAVLLHLIVAVIPDPAACLREAARVLKPGGRIAVFDKFLPDGVSPSFPRRLANTVTSTLFTDLNRAAGRHPGYVGRTPCGQPRRVRYARRHVPDRDAPEAVDTPGWRIGVSL